MKKYSIAIIACVNIIMLWNSASAQDHNLYTLDKKIPLAGDGGYDYLFIDQRAEKLYVSHGTAVHVIDLKNEELTGTIDKMQGNHGIAIASGAGKGFISDGTANAVLVFDIITLQTITSIPLSGKKPDAIIYDPFSNQVFAFNGSSDNASVINVNTLKETATIALGGAPEFAVSDGHGKIYNNLEDKNIIKVVDSKTLKVIDDYPLSPCGGPTGLALDSVNKRLFTVCRENKGMSVVDIKSGKVIATVPIGAGVDAVAYDAETKLIFCSNGDGTVTIIKQESPDKYSVAQTLLTQPRAKTLALDTRTHKIYLSVADLIPGTKDRVAGSFKVLVYKLNK
ncbi:MAG: beta-propeller repeat-containing protein [Chitinophagaceae bacterium]|nr:beta-propeller repeat-containing protein [Chitinophagaceae bacterium]